MPDREKVMEALDCLANGGGIYDCLRFPCPYGFYGYTDCHKWEIARDALELLKEQEAPSKEELIAHYGKMYKCRKCGLEWYQQTQKYCQECGTVVKWT